MDGFWSLLALLQVMGNKQPDTPQNEDSVTDWDWVFQDQEKYQERDDDIKMVREIPVYKVYTKVYNC